MSRSRVKCAACNKRIPAHEPDVILRKLDGGRHRFYHTRCTGAALELVTGAPQAWLMTVRHVEEMAN